MSFKLAVLLKLRKNKENSIKKDFSEIQNHLISQKKRLEFIENVGSKVKTKWDKVIDEGLDPNMLDVYSHFFAGNENQKRIQKKIILEIDGKANLKRTLLVEAMRDRKTLEILKKKQIEQERNIKLKMETAILDEIANLHWYRR